MKKLMTLAMIAVMSLGLVACGSSSKKDTTDVGYLIEADEDDDSLNELRSEMFKELGKETSGVSNSKGLGKSASKGTSLSDVPKKDTWNWTTVEGVTTDSGATIDGYCLTGSGRYVEFDLSDEDFTTLHFICEPWSKYDDESNYLLMTTVDHEDSGNYALNKGDDPVEVILDISGARDVKLYIASRSSKYDDERIYIYDAYFE